MWALQSQTVPLLEGDGVGLRSLWCRGLSFISPAATLGPLTSSFYLGLLGISRPPTHSQRPLHAPLLLLPVVSVCAPTSGCSAE
jgi:hypothetical protein